jgi:hypothetical protein
MKDKHFFILTWMLTTVVCLCSIHRHKTVWCNLVLLVKASIRKYERGWLCCVMTSGENIFTSKWMTTKFYQIQNLILKMDIRAFLDSMVNDNRRKPECPLWKYAKLYRTKGKFPNVMKIYRNKTRKRTNQLSVRIQLIEGLLLKHANAVEHKVLGRHLSDKPVPRLRERNFIYKNAPTVKKSRIQKWCVVC